MRRLDFVDRWLAQADRSLATLASARPARRPVPLPSLASGAVAPVAASVEPQGASPGTGPVDGIAGSSSATRADTTRSDEAVGSGAGRGQCAATLPVPVETPLSDSERRLAGALMRVNHVGEVCAQALYEGQASSTDSEDLRREFMRAADEESDHLAWTRNRLSELGAQPSLFNPIWYLGAFTIGLLAGRLGDRVSLGFMAETERQVEQHLAGHLERLPPGDRRSRAIVEQMKADEAAHASFATEAGGVELPLPVRAAMRAAARVMTRTAHYL